MKQKHRLLLGIIAGALLLNACDDAAALAKSSFGEGKNAKSAPASVISMGRDDNDGLAKKWAIGSGEQ